jgi:hypothetical protein
MKGKWTTKRPTKAGWYKVYGGSDVEFVQIEYESESTRKDRIKHPDDYPDGLGKKKELILWMVAKDDEIYLRTIKSGQWWSVPEELPEKPSKTKSP